MTDLMDRLRAADPVSEPVAAPPVEWLVAQLDAPRVASPARRHRPRGRVLVPVFTATVALAVAALLGRGSSPDVVAEARAALGPPGGIVHTVTRTERFNEAGKRLSPGHYMDKGNLSDRTEQWAALNPLRSHTRMTILPPGGGAPLSLDSDYAGGIDRSARSWSKALHVYPLPAERVAEYEAANTGSASALDAGADPVAGIRALLADRKLTPAGETDVDGRRVLRLRGERSERVGDGARAFQLTVGVEYLVDATSYAPVQVTYRVTPASWMAGAKTIRMTFETYERLPLEGNEALLRIPDAEQRRVIEHR